MMVVDPCPEIAPERWEAHLEDDTRTLEASRLTDQLTERLVRRLAEAWRDLNYQYLRSRLRAPSIRLHEGQRRWGTWDPARRLITISRRQVLCYTWESVVETLKHEMAHQWVTEVLFRDGEPPHGPAFHEACALLAVDPAAAGDGGVPLFRAGGAGTLASPDDARLTRVQKLLALADNNPDEHEAKAAFARASELMLKYNLDATQVEEPRYAHRFLGESTGRVPHHRYVIAGLLQEFFFVQCIWIDSFSVHSGVRGHRLEVMGTPANVEMAEYVHDCLVRQCEALWQAYKREHGVKDRTAKRAYMDGLLTGFRRQLRRTTKESEERGLVWVGDPGLDAFAERRHPRTTRARLAAVGSSRVREHGVSAGERMRLHRPVSAASSRGRLLPGPRG